MTPEEARERCSFVRQLLAGVGLDVFDGEMLENFLSSAHTRPKSSGKALQLLGKKRRGCRRRQYKYEKAGGRLLDIAAQEGNRTVQTGVELLLGIICTRIRRMSVYARRIW